MRPHIPVRLPGLRRTVASLSLLLTAAAAGSATALATAACHPPPREPAVAPGTDATLEVDNRGFADMTIYLLRGTQRVRLGLSTGNSKQRFRIPGDLVAGALTLRFLADPVGGTRAPVSDEIAIRPGDTVTLLIPPM